MSRQSRAGNAFAEKVAAFLREEGFPYAERRVLYGANDRGDLTGTPGITWQVKATKDIDLAEGTKEANQQAANNGDVVRILVNKGRRKPVADAYGTLPLWLLTLVLRAAGFGQPLTEAETKLLYGGSTRPPAIAPPAPRPAGRVVSTP